MVWYRRQKSTVISLGERYDSGNCKHGKSAIVPGCLSSRFNGNSTGGQTMDRSWWSFFLLTILISFTFSTIILGRLIGFLGSFSSSSSSLDKGIDGGTSSGNDSSECVVIDISGGSDWE